MESELEKTIERLTSELKHPTGVEMWKGKYQGATSISFLKGKNKRGKFIWGY